MLVVVGSGNSSNSVRLVEVALEAGARSSIRVDTAAELSATELSAAEIQLLRSVSFVFKDKTGGIHGVLINV